MTEDGKSLADTPQGIWRLPTINEAVRSLTRHDKNSGGVWNSETGRASYEIKPDKESPLWDTHSQIIYWWTSTEKDDKKAYIIVYHGGVFLRSKDLAMGSQAFRAVKEAPEESDEAKWSKLIPPEKLKEDLDFLFNTIAEIHPNMYAYTKKQEFTKHLQQLYKGITHPMSVLEFYKIAAPIFASLKSGHTYIEPFMEELKKFAESGGKVFPLTLHLDRTKAILVKNYTSTPLPIGGTVLTMNGRQATNLLSEFASWFPGENRNTNPDVLEQPGLFGWLLRLECGPVESWTVEIKAPNGVVNKYIVKPVPLAEIMGGLDAVEKRNYCKWVLDYHAALLNISHFGGNLEKFKRFLAETFQKIQNQKVSNLIIDIRENPGGNSNSGDALLEYLTERPYRQFEEAEIKLSAQAEQGLIPLRQENPGLFENKKQGDIISFELPLRKPADSPLRFKGRVFVLIGPRSFSSSASFAAAIKEFQIGKLIGEETGDPTIVYGNIIKTTLPNSELVVGVPGRAFVLAGGKEGGRGVLPDYEVKQKPEDMAKGVDTALQFTLNLIKGKQ